MQFYESLALGLSRIICTFLSIDRIKQYKDYTIPYPVFFREPFSLGPKMFDLFLVQGKTAILVMGRLYVPVVLTSTFRTRPSSPGCTSKSLPIDHFPRRALGSDTTTISSGLTFRFSTRHFFLGTSDGNTSLFQRFQNESMIFCTNSTLWRGCSFP